MPLIFFPLSFFLFTNREEEERYRTISSTIERKFLEILVVRPRYVRDTLSLSVNFSFAQKISSGGKGRKKGGKKKKGGRGERKIGAIIRFVVDIASYSFLPRFSTSRLDLSKRENKRRYCSLLARKRIDLHGSTYSASVERSVLLYVFFARPFPLAVSPLSSRHYRRLPAGDPPSVHAAIGLFLSPL